MNENIKNYLGYALILAIVVSSFSAISYVRTYSNSIEPGTYRSFSVSGEGKVVAVPDVAAFSFSVITQGGKDLGSLQKENTTKVNKIIEFIKSKGVAAKDIKTENYSVEPRYANYTCKPVIMASDSAVAYPVDRSCHPPDIVGYTITTGLQV